MQMSDVVAHAMIKIDSFNFVITLQRLLLLVLQY